MTLHLPVEPRTFWILVLLVGVVGASFLLTRTLPGIKPAEDGWLTRARRTLGLMGLDPGLFVLGAMLWLGLSLLLTYSLFLLILGVAFAPPPTPSNPEGIWEFRFLIAQLVALAGVLGGLVALPITLQRLRLTREQAKTAEDALFNTKIAEAAADLHARREESTEMPDGTWREMHMDDIVRRNAAIDRLEGLVRERPSEAGRVSRLLSVYVRELSRENPPERLREQMSIQEFIDFHVKLGRKRTDMQSAAKSLGKLALIPRVAGDELQSDLDQANLQNFDLSGLDFRNAQFRWAAVSFVNFSKSNLQGADFIGCNFDITVKLTDTALQCSVLKFCEISIGSEIVQHLAGMFGDASVRLPNGVEPPAHWPKFDMGLPEFLHEWRKWRANPGIYAPPDPPEDAG